MVRFLRKIIGDEKAQTSVEYILLIAAIVAIMTSIFATIRDQMIARQNPCPPEDTSLGCSITRALSSFGTGGTNFRYFSLRK